MRACSCCSRQQAVAHNSSFELPMGDSLPLDAQAARTASSLCITTTRSHWLQVRIVEHAFDIIHLLTDQNPIQIVVDAIINRCGRLTATNSSSRLQLQQDTKVMRTAHVTAAVVDSSSN